MPARHHQISRNEKDITEKPCCESTVSCTAAAIYLFNYSKSTYWHISFTTLSTYRYIFPFTTKALTDIYSVYYKNTYRYILFTKKALTYIYSVYIKSIYRYIIHLQKNHLPIYIPFTNKTSYIFHTPIRLSYR